MKESHSSHDPSTAQSIPPHHEIDISDNDLDATCDHIADWLEANELLGLYV